ncbi:MAG: hypothetical protein RIK87_24285 [Fuerstiella sp.]
MKHSKLKRAAFIIALGVLWFIAVDWSWFVHDCPDCGHGEDTAEYRVFSATIHKTNYEYPSVLQQVATDLGTPCTHPNMETWHKQRRWGLLCCKWPCINGIHRLTGRTTWYDQSAATKISALTDREPTLYDEYKDRVFKQHDFKFLRVVLDRAGVDHPIPD